jgi:hypothetical protein
VLPVREDRRWLALAGLALLACSGKTHGSSSLCLDGVTCPDEIELAESEPGCTPCEECADRLGACDDGGIACARDRVDLDAEYGSGCESHSSELEASFRARQTGEAIETVSLNGRDFSAGTAVEVVAVEPLAPGCVPTFEASCPYTLIALKLGFEEFTFDDVTWGSGAITLTGPLSVEDDGPGIGIEGEVVAGFELSQGDERRRVLAAGSIEARLVLAETPTLLLELRDFDFGAYRLEKIWMTAELERF